MRLCNFSVQNYRSIVAVDDIRIERLQAFVGCNNAGKSNILRALSAFLSAGAGGIREEDFFNVSKPIVLKATFDTLTGVEQSRLRQYLINNILTLEKHVQIAIDAKTGRSRVVSEYHGYEASPVDWWLSVEGVVKEKGRRPNWIEIATDRGLAVHMPIADGKLSKEGYEAGLTKYLRTQGDIQYETPKLGETQALGLQPVLVGNLPQMYLLPAITDYADEIDRRSTTTVFRQLMGDLAGRVLKADPRFAEIETSLQKVGRLLNPVKSPDGPPNDERLTGMVQIEEKLRSAIGDLMPSVQDVKLEVVIEATEEMFSRGVCLKIDDGVLTDVLLKGHGLQRCVVFGLLRALISAETDASKSLEEGAANSDRAIILAMEEPELYIHPQLQRLIFRVLRSFAMATGRSDSVLYTTHSPAFVDVGSYESIAVVRKDDVKSGTLVRQCGSGSLGDPEEMKGFQFINSFDVSTNSLFFSRRVILVEGEQDEVVVVAVGRELKLFDEFPEEIEFSIVVAGNKENIPKFQKLLNAFELPYAVLLERDGKPLSEKSNQDILDLLNGNSIAEIEKKIEDAVDHQGHFKRTFNAKQHMADPKHFTAEIRAVVAKLFESRVVAVEEVVEA